MEWKAPLPPIFRNKKVPKAPESDTPRVGNQLVRMRSPVQIWIAAPKNSRNRMISGVFVLFFIKIMWVGKWVRRVDPQLDPHGEMRGKVQRVPERKFGLPLIILLCNQSVKRNAKGVCVHMKDQNCGYCMRGELLDAFGIYICDLSVSTLILFKEQSHPGRCIVAYKDHVGELVDISEEDRNAFFADIARAAKAIHKVFHPSKVNYGAYGDGGCHLHFHLVPKYEGQFEWGSVFQMNPGKTYLAEEEYAEIIKKIKQAL